MKILFIHPNMPGQFKHLARIYGALPDYEVAFITKPKPDVNIPGVQKVEYVEPREPSVKTHRYLISSERGVLVGQEVYRAARRLMQGGFVPDVIVGHPGWGDMLFLRDLWPDVPQLHFCEFFYNARGSDVGFDPDAPSTEDDAARIRIKNTIHLHSLASATWGYAPTHWQHQQFPEVFRPSISVVHDGIDMQTCAPNDEASFTLPGGGVLTKKDKLVTYVARNFEPYRGIGTFMQAAKLILDRDPEVRIVAVGSDGVSYGKKLPPGQSYRKIWLNKVPGLDLSRLHFVGHLPYDQLLDLFRITRAHIYLTYPFVLSWSMLEAMACGAPVIGSSTPPVEEVINHGLNGWLVDFFSPEEVAEAVHHALKNDEERVAIQNAARQTVQANYDFNDCLPKHMAMIAQLADGESGEPSPSAIVDARDLLLKLEDAA